MNFAFCRDYRFENENDSKVFFEKVHTTNKIGVPTKLDEYIFIEIYETENKHIELDSFAWENKNLWPSYKGSW